MAKNEFPLEKTFVTAGDLIEHYPQNVCWAYATLKTMFSRLVIKKAISERKRGNTSMYEPFVSNTFKINNSAHLVKLN